MLQKSEQQLIQRIKKLDEKATKSPWYPQDPGKGKTVYRVGPNDEALICTLRNNIAELVRIIERLTN